MDAITLLKADHKTVESLFKRYEKAGDGAHKEKQSVADRVVEELSIHAAIEEQVFYPVIRMTVPGVEDMTLESLEEHHIVKWVLSEIAGMDPSDERFDAKMTVLMENVRHHVEEEQTDLFPKVRDALSRKQLADVGDALEKAKKVAPTRPHPRSPDSPPANLVVGTAAGVADKITDTVTGAAHGGIDAAHDLIAAILGSRPAPERTTGSSTQRRAAKRVRSGAATAEKQVAKTARKASGRSGRATSTAKRTTTKAARSTKTAAKRAR